MHVGSKEIETETKTEERESEEKNLKASGPFEPVTWKERPQSRRPRTGGIVKHLLCILKVMPNAAHQRVFPRCRSTLTPTLTMCCLMYCSIVWVLFHLMQHSLNVPFPTMGE